MKYLPLLFVVLTSACGDLPTAPPAATQPPVVYPFNVNDCYTIPVYPGFKLVCPGDPEYVPHG